MKKNILLCFFLVGLVFFSGCIRANEFSEYPGISVSEHAPEEPYPYDDNEVQQLTEYRAAADPGGYYFIQKAAFRDPDDPDKTKEGNLLCYYDLEAAETVLLCTNTACRHESESCEAYLYTEPMDRATIGKWLINCTHYKLFYYDDHLYMLTKDRNFDSYLNCYDRDYTNEKQGICLTKSAASPRSLLTEPGSSLIFNGWFYYLNFQYDENCSGERSQGKDTVFSFCRVRIDGSGEVENLYEFSFPADYAGFMNVGSGMAFQILQSGGDVFCIAAASYRDDQTKDQTEQRVIRYNDRDGAKLVWNYSGNKIVNLMGAAGNGPVSAEESFMDESQILYFISEPNSEQQGTAISSVDLKTGEGKSLYSSTLGVISQLRTDGEHIFFMEGSVTRQYLTAIDKSGKLLRRYCFEYTEEQEEHVRKVEANGGVEPIPEELKDLVNEESMGNIQALPDSDRAELLVTDSRYLMIADLNCFVFRDLLPAEGAYRNTYAVGIGLISTEDFLRGTEVKIRKINLWD